MDESRTGVGEDRRAGEVAGRVYGGGECEGEENSWRCNGALSSDCWISFTESLSSSKRFESASLFVCWLAFAPSGELWLSPCQLAVSRISTPSGETTKCETSSLLLGLGQVLALSLTLLFGVIANDLTSSSVMLPILSASTLSYRGKISLMLRMTS